MTTQKDKKTSRIFGYVRVSTKEQNTDRQVRELAKYVPVKANIMIDKASGKDFDRPQYQALKTIAAEGDTIFIKSLDRLGRNKSMIKQELQDFKDKGVIVKVLDVPTTLMDFSQFGDFSRAIMEMVNDVLIEVLGTIAEQERKTIRQRQSEGIAAAKARGKKLGRPTKGRPENWDAIYRQWQSKQITAVAAAKAMDMSRAQFYVLKAEYEQELQQSQQPRKAGRKKIDRPRNWQKVYALYKAKKINHKEAAKRLGLSKTKFYEFKREYEDSLKAK